MYNRYQWPLNRLDKKTLKALFGKWINPSSQPRPGANSITDSGAEAAQNIPEWATMGNEQIGHIMRTGRSWVDPN